MKAWAATYHLMMGTHSKKRSGCCAVSGHPYINRDGTSLWHTEAEWICHCTTHPLLTDSSTGHCCISKQSESKQSITNVAAIPPERHLLIY